MEFNAMQAVKQALLTLVVLALVNCTGAEAAPGSPPKAGISAKAELAPKAPVNTDREFVKYMLLNPDSVYEGCRGHDHMTDSADAYADIIISSARRTGVDPRIPTVLMLRESCFKRTAVNGRTGAFGMGGMLPSTAKRVCDSANVRYGLGYKCGPGEYRKPSVYTTLVMVTVDIYRKYYRSDLHAFAAYTGSNPGRGEPLGSSQMRRALAVKSTLTRALAIEKKIVGK